VTIAEHGIVSQEIVQVVMMVGKFKAEVVLKLDRFLVTAQAIILTTIVLTTIVQVIALETART
jgi:hypothetical protein